MHVPRDIWLSNPAPPRYMGRAGLFLDRDGVLVKEVNYLKNKQDVALEAGAAALLRWGCEKGLGLVCVTNQSGIARNLIAPEEFEAVEAEIARQLAAAGAHLPSIPISRPATAPNTASGESPAPASSSMRRH